MLVQYRGLPPLARRVSSHGAGPLLCMPLCAVCGLPASNGRHDAEMYYRNVRPMEGRSVAIIKQGHWNQLY